MYQDPNMMRFFQQLQAGLQWQAEKLRELEVRIVRMGEDMAAIRDRKHTSIEKIEYNFDQLKVEKLEGTLNIGITPGGLGSIEDLAVGDQKGNQETEAEEESFRRMYFYLNRYVHLHIPAEMQRLEKAFGRPLDNATRERIMMDLIRQIEPRIRHYWSQMTETAGKEQLVETAPQTIEQMVIQKVQKDITEALDEYFTKPAKGMEGNTNESQRDQ